MLEEIRDIRARQSGQRGGRICSPGLCDCSIQGSQLAAVYAPVGRRVVQYVNREQISSAEIIDKFHITTLRIGAAEIGNWGQPFRKTAWFAVRNLNETIDELAVFNAAIGSEETHTLDEQGKPLGY